jgi:hypothetical protein
MRKIGVAQEFVRDEKREIKGRRAENELYREQAMLGDARAALRRDVAQAWIERYFAERMAKVVDKQYAEADLLAVQVNLQSLLDRRADYRRQAARATALLSRWLGAESVRPLAALPDRLLPASHNDVTAHAASHPHRSHAAHCRADDRRHDHRAAAVDAGDTGRLAADAAAQIADPATRSIKLLRRVTVGNIFGAPKCVPSLQL